MYSNALGFKEKTEREEHRDRGRGRGREGKGKEKGCIKAYTYCNADFKWALFKRASRL